MSHFDTSKIPLGKTFFGPAQTPSATDQDMLGAIGVEKWMNDLAYDTSNRVVRRSNRLKLCRLVLNASGFTVLAKRLVKLKTGVYNQQIDGYATVTADGPVYPVDELLTQTPAAGCRDSDACWIVLRGPALCLTDLAGADNNVIAAGGVLMALTGATSQCTTSGRVAPQDLTGSTAPLGNAVQNAIGRALSAKTTTQTNGDVLVDIVTRW